MSNWAAHLPSSVFKICQYPVSFWAPPGWVHNQLWLKYYKGPNCFSHFKPCPSLTDSELSAQSELHKMNQTLLFLHLQLFTDCLVHSEARHSAKWPTYRVLYSWPSHHSMGLLTSPGRQLPFFLLWKALLQIRCLLHYPCWMRSSSIAKIKSWCPTPRTLGHPYLFLCFQNSVSSSNNTKAYWII